jgi:hypothetical protein
MVEEAAADEHAGEMQDHQHSRDLTVKPEGKWAQASQA